MTTPATPSYHDDLLDLAEDALDQGDPVLALELCERVLGEAPEHAGALFLSAEACRDFRDLEEAEHRYRQVTRLTPDHSPSWSGLAAVLLDQLDLEGARTFTLRALRADPLNPEAYYWRAMLRERREDYLGADRDYRRAWRLDPEGYPLPEPLSDALVEAVVEDALRTLHPSIRSYLSQVPILLEEVPDAETCLEFEPPAAPGELLGYFSGLSLMERSLDNPWSAFPSAIVLFRRNLSRLAQDRDELIRQLQITVFHEVGHYLGLDEADLDERGLG